MSANFNIENSKIEQLNNSGNNYKITGASALTSLEESRLKERNMEKTRILFLAANPKKTTQIRLDEEAREIESKIRAAEFRGHFESKTKWAVRADDILQAFNEFRPHIVHFSGHGSDQSELFIEDKQGNPQPISEAAIVSLFRNVKDDIRLVVLNACYSEKQAQAISNEIDCTIGMNDAIGLQAAIEFASQFYGALAFGRSVKEAFEQGQTALLLHGIHEDTTPVLLVKPGVDAQLVSFVNHPTKHPVLSPLAIEVLLEAVNGNTAINYGTTDGGAFITAGDRVWDAQGNYEMMANLDDAITQLLKNRLIKLVSDKQYHFTRAGIEDARKRQPQTDPHFADVKKEMPELIAEMKKDLQQNRHVREFFVMEKKSHCLGGTEKDRFIYYEEDHENLRGKLDILENYGYIHDVTPKDLPIYRMSEAFVKLVRGHS